MDLRELEAISRRPFRYWNEDGLTDIVGGMSLLAMGTMTWAALTDRPLVGLLALGTWLSVSGLWGGKLLRRAKERLVFPRTGRVDLRVPEAPDQKASVVVLFLILLALPATLFFARDVFPAALVLVSGLGLAGVILSAGIQLGIRRYVLMAALYVPFSIWVALEDPGPMGGLPLLFVGIGAGQLVCGIITLAAFLRSAPPAAQE